MANPFKPKESKPELEQEPKPTWAQIISRGRLPKPSLQQPATQQGPSRHVSTPPRQPATDQGPLRHRLPPKPPPQQVQPKQLPFKQVSAQESSSHQSAAIRFASERGTSQPILSQRPSSEDLPSEQLSSQEPVDQYLRRSIAYLLRFEQAHPGFGIDNTIVTRSVFATEIDALGCTIDKMQALVVEHREGYGSDEDENSGVWVQGEELIHHKVVLRVEIVAVKHPWRAASY